jgi:hypothetical protein
MVVATVRAKPNASNEVFSRRTCRQACSSFKLARIIVFEELSCSNDVTAMAAQRPFLRLTYVGAKPDAGQCFVLSNFCPSTPGFGSAISKCQAILVAIVVVDGSSNVMLRKVSSFQVIASLRMNKGTEQGHDMCSL